MRRPALMCVLVALTLAIAGCGSGSNPIAVTLSPGTAQSVMAGQTVAVTATVANDSKNGGVTWSLTGPGSLSGQSATSVTYTAPSPVSASATVTITATSATDSTKTAALTVNLQAVSVAVSPNAAQTVDQGQTVAVTATVSNDPQTKGVTWSLSGGGTLSGQTATAVTYTAPASVTSASTATITATSGFDNTKTATLTVNLVPPPSVTTTSLAGGQVGVAYSASLAASNGISPYTWSITAGALPAGLTLSGNTISGTPTAYGTFNFTVQVKDAAGLTATASLSIKVAPAPLNVTTTSLPNGIVNSVYSANLQSTGGASPITWSVTVGSLPAGLALNTATGAISGTPTTAGTSNFTVQAADSSSPQLTATKALSITIIPVLSVTTTSLPNGITSTAYSATLASAGGSGAVTWSVTLGSLPAGLSLNASTGAITGTPTTAGTSSFTVQAADSGSPQQKVTKALSITIVQQLTVTTASLPAGAVTSLYSATLQSSGGTPAITWAISAGALPAGLALNTSTGAISGTPTASGTFQFTAQATDSGNPQQTATAQLSIIINPVLAITTTSPMPSGSVNTAYSQQVQTNGGGISPLSWSITAGSLPAGLSLNSNTGVIAGTPTATGTSNFTVQAADSGTPQQTASKALSISIASAPLSISTTGLPSGVVGQAYNGVVLQSAGGNPPVTWSISAGSLPSWASLNASTGAITGTPNAAGATTFTVKATDSSVPAQSATKQLSITVVLALSITTSSLPNGTVGSAYSASVSATGGTTPYAWSWAPQSGSSLPPGLSINSGSGAITGTPGGSGGTYNVTVTVVDSTSPQQSASANYTITISVAPLAVATTSGNLPQGTINTAYPSTQLNANGGIPPYTWALNSGALPAGLSLSSGGAISGTPTTAGTASFTVQVSDSATPTKHTATANLSITVNTVPACTTMSSESMLNGQYAFVLKGFDNGTGIGETRPQPALVGGVLTFNGSGTITAGALDMNLNSGVQTNLAVTSATYGVGSDQRGCMVITTSAGTLNFRLSLGNISSGVASTGHVIDMDSAGPFVAGTIRKQTITQQLSGNFAFGASSAQNSAFFGASATAGGKNGFIGVLDFSSAGSVTGGEVDFNQNGALDGSAANTTWPTSPISITGGSYSISSNGRGTLTFTPSGATAVTAVAYVVSSSDVLVLSTNNQTTDSLFAGEALQQSGTPFSANPLSGSYVGYDSGLGSTGAGRADVTLLGPLSAGSNSVSGTQLKNDGGTFKQGAITATYTVSSTGRMTISGGGGQVPILYLVSSSEAFFLNSGGSVDTGLFQSQSAGPFSNGSASGTYAFGNIDPVIAGKGQSTGVAAFASPNISLTQDSNGSGSLTVGSTQSLTYSIDSTGLGHIPSGCTIAASSTTCQTVLYIISPTKAVVMEAASNNPELTLADK